MCTPLMLGGVVIAFDALKARDVQDFKGIITEVLKREEMFQEVRTITLLGALDKVLHPMGFQIQVGNKSFVGAHARAIEEEVSRKVDSYVSMLQHSAEECEEKGVEIQVKIAVGAPLMNILVEEISALHATWAIIDRLIRKESRCYLKQLLPCKVAQVRDNLTVEIVRPYHLDSGMKKLKHKLVYSLSKVVPLPPAQDYESDGNSLISLPVTPMIRSKACTTNSKEQLVSLNDESSTNNPQQEASGSQNELENELDGCTQVMLKDRCTEDNSKAPVPCSGSVTRTREDAVGSSFSEMKIEPGEYSSDTSPEEGKIGLVKMA
ncbi:hypothetical protein C2S52_011541 [Perilla frutescens var. hirtella]|nr:hypothetical protein C2S52_011541 [Perilla frutescens var. hirtella]